MEKNTSLGTKLEQNEETSAQEMLSNQTFYVEEEKLKCMICGFASNQLVSHIKAKHNMSSKEYKNAFLGAKLGKFTNAQNRKNETNTTC